MDLVLTRDEYLQCGIFGQLTCPNDRLFFLRTLEHAYQSGDSYQPKIPIGKYTCVRGIHRLQIKKPEFETFEIKGVKGHWGLLFHPGNYNRDSKGCVLIGKELSRTHDGAKMLTKSRQAFIELMEYLNGLEWFNLTVE